MLGRSKSGKSTRQLMGIDEITQHGVKTPYGELAYFYLKPDNLSILSSEGVRGRVKALTDLLKSSAEARLIALDSRESYRQNQEWYRGRLDHEDVPAIAELLQKDIAHLDSIQAEAASSREFLLAYRIDKTSDDVSTLEQRTSPICLGKEAGNEHRCLRRQAETDRFLLDIPQNRCALPLL